MNKKLFYLHQKVVFATNQICFKMYLKSSFLKNDNFLLRIPSNINQTAVGLF